MACPYKNCKKCKNNTSLIKDFEIQVLANQTLIMTSLSRILRDLLPQSETVDTLCKEIYGATTSSIQKICDAME